MKDILIVEDDEPLRMLMMMALEEEGYEVRQAGNGCQGLEEVARHIPNLILLDLRMPKMDGRGFAEAFHSSYGDTVPIVVVTANPDWKGAIRDIHPVECP